MAMRVQLLRLGLAALVGGGAVSEAATQAPTPTELVVFAGGFNWPIWVGRDKGLFARQRVEVKVTPTPNSAFQLTSRIEGTFGDLVEGDVIEDDAPPPEGLFNIGEECFYFDSSLDQHRGHDTGVTGRTLTLA